MKSSRTPHSVSSYSSRSYMSDRTRHKSGSSRHSDDTKKPTRKMKFIIAIGIALPIIAAIIGVVAWAVSADTAFHGPVANSLRRSDIHLEHPEEDIFQALEDRHDLEYSKHFPELNDHIEKFSNLDTVKNQDYSRVDTVENHNQFDDNPSKDPLYIVHFVPSPKPKVKTSTSDPNLASTVSNEILQKILSASKGAKPGTPQFVVFAPIPEEEGVKDEAAGTLQIGSQGVNSLSSQQFQDGEIDYDYEAELRKYQELVDSTGNPPRKETSRLGQAKGTAHTEVKSHEAVKVLTQNLTTGNVYHAHHHQMAAAPSNSFLQANNFDQQQSLQQQQLLIPQQNYQQNTQGPAQGYQQAIPQGHASQHVEKSHNYGQYEQNYPQQQESYSNQQIYPQSHATDRSGQSQPVGIKLNFGGGRGLLGGNYSPLGIIRSILRPILPKPQVNLNGKVMFGVMLDSGLKLGDRGQNYG